jgi:hypothetical protein
MIKSNKNILRGITVMALTASLMSPTFASADSIDPRIIGGEENTGAVYSDPTYTSTEIEEFNNQAINFDAEIAAWEVENYDILYNPD